VNEEDWAYVSKTATTLVGVVGITKAHSGGQSVESAEDYSTGAGAASTLNGAHSIGATTLNYFDTGGGPTVSEFPATGSLLLSEGLAAEETVTYTGRTATQFTGVSSLVNNHADGATVQGSGGVFSGVLE
jgi:hypothetical protein